MRSTLAHEANGVADDDAHARGAKGKARLGDHMFSGEGDRRGAKGDACGGEEGLIFMIELGTEGAGVA